MLLIWASFEERSTASAGWPLFIPSVLPFLPFICNYLRRPAYIFVDQTLMWFSLWHISRSLNVKPGRGIRVNVQSVCSVVTSTLIAQLPACMDGFWDGTCVRNQRTVLQSQMQKWSDYVIDRNIFIFRARHFWWEAAAIIKVSGRLAWGVETLILQAKNFPRCEPSPLVFSSDVSAGAEGWRGRGDRQVKELMGAFMGELQLKGSKGVSGEQDMTNWESSPQHTDYHPLYNSTALVLQSLSIKVSPCSRSISHQPPLKNICPQVLTPRNDWEVK